MRNISFNAGDTILTEGEAGNTAFLILAGTVEIVIGEGAHAKSVGKLEAGEVFGEMSLIDPGPRSASVKAVSNTKCVETSFDDFIASIEGNPEQALEFTKTLVRRLRHMNELMISMDPQRRSIRDIAREWQQSAGPQEAKLGRETNRRRDELMDYWV